VKHWPVALSVAATLTLLGCGGDLTEPPDSAHMRFVNAAPTVSAADLLVDGNAIITDQAYATASNRIVIAPGVRNLRVRPTGKANDLSDATHGFEAATDYTVLLGGNPVASAPLILTNDSNAPPSGATELRIVHVSPGAGGLDIYLTAPGDPLDASSRIVTNAAFGASSSYLLNPPGTYQVRATHTGTTNVVIDSGTLTLASGDIRTLLLLDAPGGGAPFETRVLADR
jgi:hypothetical protein